MLSFQSRPWFGGLVRRAEGCTSRPLTLGNAGNAAQRRSVGRGGPAVQKGLDKAPFSTADAICDRMLPTPSEIVLEQVGDGKTRDPRVAAARAARDQHRTVVAPRRAPEPRPQDARAGAPGGAVCLPTHLAGTRHHRRGGPCPRVRREDTARGAALVEFLPCRESPLPSPPT